jgi:hypothetical protein
LQQPYFQISSHSEILGARTSTYGNLKGRRGSTILPMTNKDKKNQGIGLNGGPEKICPSGNP